MNIVIPKPVNEVLTILYENNYDGYIMGGTVRNLILGIKPKNYQISTNASLKVVEKLLKDYDTFYCGEKNSVLGIANPRFPMEISTYHTPSNNLEDELMEKDFTMNAMAFSEEDGLIDYTTGIIDIRDKVIRINGEDDTIFVKDPLRILRAIRLSAEYGMRIDRETQEYMYDNKDLLANVAKERIRDELSKLLVAYRADFYIKKYFDIFLVIIPELALIENFMTNDPRHIYDVLEHTLVTIKKIDPVLELRLAMLFHDIAKPFTFSKDENGIGHFKDHAKKGAEMAREILNRFKFNKKTIQKVAKLIEYHEYEIPEKDLKIKEFLSEFGREDIEDLFKVKKINFYAKNPAYVSDLSVIEAQYERLANANKKTYFIKRNELKVTGRDLIDLGLSQESIGEAIDRIYREILAGNLKNNHDKIIAYAVENLLSN